MLQDKDIPKLILEYKTRNFNVFLHVVKKYLNNPAVPEKEKNSMRKFSAIIDQIRTAAQSATAGSLSSIYRLSESLGKNLASNTHSILNKHTREIIKNGLEQSSVIYYLKEIYSKALTKGTTSLLTLPNQLNELGKFVTAGAYENLKKPLPTTQEVYSKKKINRNAAKRKKEKKAAKLEKRENLERYNTTKPTVFQKTKYYSGYDELSEAYNIVKNKYIKQDKVVKQSMDAMLSKITAKATAQEELEARRIIQKNGLEKPLSWYDKIRSVAIASTLVTQANLYRSGRLLGSIVRDAATFLDSRTAKTNESQNSSKNSTQNHYTANRNMNNHRRNSGRTR